MPNRNPTGRSAPRTLSGGGALRLPLLWCGVLCGVLCSHAQESARPAREAARAASAEMPAPDATFPAADEPETSTGFAVREIDDRTFARMQGRSYKAGCTVPRTQLRRVLVLHYDFAGRVRRGELICNRAIAGDLLEIFRALYEARYPIARIEPIDAYEADDVRSMEADNTSSFNFRPIAGSTRLSRHSLGMAVDINPLRNPCVRQRNGVTVVEPEAGRPYADRTRDFPGRLHADDLCVRLFKARGFRWGGDWRSLKDYQHFEK